MDEGNSWRNPKILGALFGLALGIVVILAGVLNALLVALLVSVGWIVGKYVLGEVDLDDMYDRHLRGRTRGHQK
ncbi:MAG: DUF2273 domain-containing protein [Chloroflexota bacterium]|nr:DUF2273 domain-containing protein [Chloroflexota bacterium]